MAVLSESPCLAKRSNKNFETFGTKINMYLKTEKRTFQLQFEFLLSVLSKVPNGQFFFKSDRNNNNDAGLYVAYL